MKKTLAFLLAIIFVFFTPVLSACAQDKYIKKSAFVFSDSGIMFEFVAIGKNVDKAFSDMLVLMEEIDNQTNINRAGSSDVLNINLAKTGEDIEIGFYTYQMIEKAKEYYSLTSGAFNVAAYPLLYLWAIDAHGYSDYRADMYYEHIDSWIVPRSFVESDIVRNLPLPDYKEVQRVKDFCDLDMLEIFERDGKFYARKQIDQLMIDLGGISKGYAVDLCVDICKKYNIKSAKLDLSGNLFFVGKYKNTSDWNVGVQNPGGGIFCAFAASPDSTAVTSGDYHRFRKVQTNDGEIVIPHIIDSNTGLPYGLIYENNAYKSTLKKIISCSVMSGGSAYADSLATAACVMGFTKAKKFFNDHQIKAIMFTNDKKLAITGGVSLVLTDVYNIYKEYEQEAN